MNCHNKPWCLLFGPWWWYAASSLILFLGVVAGGGRNPKASPDEDSVVTVVTVHLPTLGQVQGRRDGAIDFFGALPYAAPPVGPLRWAPPEPPAPWAPAVLDATQYGPDCWQLVDPLMNPNADGDAMSEDCLHLNVFVPAGQAGTNSRNKKQSTTGLLPVLVWLHGGAFQMGGARRPEYDGKQLAERGTVVVTLNYRLGALGFLVSSTDGIFGNFGVMDQRAALQWIQDNIRQFGGDPHNVMLFGESAGAVMTTLHLTMEPQTQPTTKQSPNNRLFHKAVIQSNPLGFQFRSVVIADFIGDALKASVDCKDLACLRAERVEEIMRAQSSLMGVPRSVGDFFTWAPTLTDTWKLSLGGGASAATNNDEDDNVSSSTTTVRPGKSGSGLPFSPLVREHVLFRDLDSWKWQRQRLGASGAWAHVNVTQQMQDHFRFPDDIPIVIGSNRHEGEMFVHGAFPITMSKPVYWMFVGALFRDSAGRVLKHYRGYVDQLEAEAAATAQRQVREEQNRQYYLEHQEQLDSEYQLLLEMNSSKVKISTVDDFVQTWSRGGGSFFDNHKMEYTKNEGETNGKPEMLWRFAANMTKEERQALKIKQRNHNRRVREEKRREKAKAKALREAAKVVVDYRPVMSRIIDDYLFRCPAWHLANTLSRDRVGRGQSNNVYVYQFSHSTHIPGFKECWGKSCHTSEIPYVFQAMDVIRSNYSTLGMYAQQEAPSSPDYPYTDIINAYRGALEAADRLGASNGEEYSNKMSPAWINERFNISHTKAFQRLLGHFFGDYFQQDADEEIASDMADRWVAFAKTGDPNYDGAPAEWRPWRYEFDDTFSRDNNGQTWNAEDFDWLFEDAELKGTGNETLAEGYNWSEDPEIRMYRRRALAALGMEVVEEDVFQTMLRRSKKKEEVESLFESVFSKHSLPLGRGRDSRRTRQAIQRLQQIAQDMGVIGRGLKGERRRAGRAKSWGEDFFPEILELKWPPEGRLVERDCTCDFWDKIRYRY